MKNFARRFEIPALIFAGAAILTLVLCSFSFSLLEAELYDLRMRWGLTEKADSKIAVVTIDDATTKALNEYAPLTLDFHTLFIETMEKIGPKALGYLVDMNRVSELHPDHFLGELGTRFLDAANRLQSSGVPVLLGTPFDVTGEVMPPYPLSVLPHSIALLHKDGNVFAGDKVTRRALVNLYDKPVFHMELAERAGLKADGSLPRGSFFVPEVDGSYFFFKYHGNTSRGSSESQSGYQTVSFHEVIRQEPAAMRLLKDKIVLVGTLTREAFWDYAYTPYSSEDFSNPKIIVHANILDSVIHDAGIIRLPNWVNWIVTFVFIALVFWSVLSFKPLYSVGVTFSLAALFLLTGLCAFSMKGIWVGQAHPLIGVFLGFYLIVPYRLIREYQKRWDYQRRNEVLTQVEELKTNFLSLVTHDLKTPVARIQGLAEVLMRKANERLLERDQETLQHIVSSTEELNRFISSILELSKVESNRIQLNRESKDPNYLIEKAVEGFRAQARAKHIEIQTEFEPLFPIRIDAVLMSKVLNNLIDNALKYSPSGSNIHVSTREIDGKVEISITDEGIGLTEQEKENLFTRFYRAKNDTTAQVGGTGLGLYLTKFFVEAHEGTVEVESEKGVGSIFRIVLPIDFPPEIQAGLKRTSFLKLRKKETHYV